MKKTATKRNPPDRYTLAIRYLRKNPDQIFNAWMYPTSKNVFGGCLFLPAIRENMTKSGLLYTVAMYNERNSDGKTVGCLTQIRNNIYDAVTDKLTEAIRNDRNIPIDENDITLDSLKHFAKWQRKVDRACNYVPPDP